MGVILSKFRKEKSTTAVLEGLQEQIHELEKFVINTQEQKRRFVSNFLGVTIGIYVVGFALWYFFYFPPTVRERIFNLVPLLIFPILIVFLRQLFTWYFQRKLNKNGDKLAALKEKKNMILEQVMDKETYKVAVNLLERFGDKKLNRITMANANQLAVSAARSQSNPALNRSQHRLPATPNAVSAASQTRGLTPYTSVYRNLNNNLNTSSSSHLQLTPAATPRSGQELRRRTPFPVVDDRERSALDRIVDFIVGDSPQNRFGMICKECHAHNGMLPMEEYEYTTFRCAFCEALNPARKERPVAPRLALQQLSEETPGTPLSGRNDSSASSSSDDEDENLGEAQLPRRVLLTSILPTDTDTANTTTTASSHNTETETENVNPDSATTENDAKAE